MVFCKYLEDKTKEACGKEGVSIKSSVESSLRGCQVDHEALRKYGGRREVSTENVWDKKVKDHLEVLQEDGYKKALAHGAERRWNLHQQHG